MRTKNVRRQKHNMRQQKRKTARSARLHDEALPLGERLGMPQGSTFTFGQVVDKMQVGATRETAVAMAFLKFLVELAKYRKDEPPPPINVKPDKEDTVQ